MDDLAIGTWLLSDGGYWGFKDNDRKHTAVVTGFSYEDPFVHEAKHVIISPPPRQPRLVVLQSTERDRTQKWSFGTFWTMWKRVGRKAPGKHYQQLPPWMASNRVLTLPEPVIIPSSRRAFEVKPNAVMSIGEVRHAWAMLMADGKFFGLFRAGELKKWFLPHLNRFERELTL